MLIAFLGSLIPLTGGITYVVANQLGKRQGFDEAIEKARAEAQADLKLEIEMREYSDHLNGATGHICGQTCRNMMKLNKLMDKNKNQN